MSEESIFGAEYEAYLAEQRQKDFALEIRLMDDSISLRKRPGGCDGCDNCQTVVPQDIEI